MTITSTSPREIKNGNGTATVFSFTFVVNQASDLVVTLVDSNNNETVLTEGTGTTNYSVSVSSYPGTGSVTYPATLGTELAGNEQLIIQRVVDIDQETDLVNQGAWKPEQVENTFDYSRMIDLQQQDELDRAIKSPASTPLGTNYTLPAPESLALFRWNEAATDLEAVQTADLVTTANFSNFKTDTFTDGVDYTAGTTTQITLDTAPGTIANTQVYFDGVYQEKADYALAGTVITFDTAIPIGVNTVEVVYGKAADVLAGSTRETQLGDGSKTVFTLSNGYEPGNGTLHVYINGVRQEVSYGYTETNANTVTFDSAPANNDLVLFIVNAFVSQTTADASNVSYTPSGTGAVATNVQAKLSESVSVKDFGAVGDGVTDDATSIQAALNSGATTVHFPPGTYAFGATVSIPSGTTLIGAGQGSTTIIPLAALGLYDPVFENPNLPTAQSTVDSDITIRAMTFDGSSRSYPAYPTAGYDTLGYMARFAAVDKVLINQVEVTGCESFGIEFRGCSRVQITDGYFHDCGKIDRISGPLAFFPYGSLWPISDITSANPAVVTVSAGHSLSNGNTVYIRGVSNGLASVPDGEYTVANATATTFELSGIDTSADTGFQQTGLGTVGAAGGSAISVIGEDVVISNNIFKDNLKCAVVLRASRSLFTGNVVTNHGEAAIFTEINDRLTVSNNYFKGVVIREITGAFIEANYLTNLVIANNQFEEFAAHALVMQGVQSASVSGNVFLEPITDASFVYSATSPIAISTGNAGNPMLDKQKCSILVSSLYTFPAKSMKIDHNVFTDNRVSPQATSIINIGKAGTNDIVYDISITENDFNNSGVAAADMIQFLSDNVCLPETLSIRGNSGHGSEGPVYQRFLSNATGLQNFDLGFVPRYITLHAYATQASYQRESKTNIVRDHNANSSSIGFGHYTALDGVTTSSTVNMTCNTVQVNNDAWRVVDAAGTIQNQAEFIRWNAESTNGIGAQLRVDNITQPLYVDITFYP
jgi:hypothetical protein